MPDQGTAEASADQLARLLQEGSGFAARLTATVQTAFGSAVPPFVAKGAQGDSRSRIAVSQAPATGIQLSISGMPRLLLLVEYWCLWDHAGQYLAVDDAKVKVLANDSREPLFRYEYLRNPVSEQPCAHLQIHAHRDAMTHLMTLSGAGSPRGERRQRSIHRQGSLPKMSELHFPLGGHRFRPCLEDVLHMLIDEFGVDTPPGALAALAVGRERWRTDQLAAAVRDSPRTAARVLQLLGYTVEPPAGGHALDRPDKLQAY